MNTSIEALISADKDSWGSALELFLKNSLEVFALPELNEGTKRKDIWEALLNIVKYSEDPNVIKDCFIAVRILGREKMYLGEVINDEWVNLMKLHSGLDNDKFEFDPDKTKICIEVLKCLSNILFNSHKLARNSVENGILDGFIKRINKFSDQSISEEIKFLDMRLFFLITALCPEARKTVNYMIENLIQILEEILKKAAQNHILHEDLPPIFLTRKRQEFIVEAHNFVYNHDHYNPPSAIFSLCRRSCIDTQADFVSEVLKVLFNLTVGVNESDSEVLATCTTLVGILRSYLLISSTKLEKTWALRNDVINLLTNMPNETFKELLVPTSEATRIIKSLEFDGQNMTAFYEILMFLKAKFNDDPKVSNQHEILSPVMTVLLKGATSYRPIRKFLRNQILPPLKEVHSRPEQGNTIRNHLCRMLTTPITQLRDLVSELLFVLCKNNVARMIKYTGYGNAAGLFAQRGLLAGGRDKGEENYSSDSEDSETEEYADHKHGINPVIGCYEEPRPSVTANMSDEQKEYEAMKLVELMDSLLKSGTIKPCTVGPDGKPKPIEHVLQLQEGLKSQQAHRKDTDAY